MQKKNTDKQNEVIFNYVNYLPLFYHINFFLVFPFFFENIHFKYQQLNIFQELWYLYNKYRIFQET